MRVFGQENHLQGFLLIKTLEIAFREPYQSSPYLSRNSEKESRTPKRIQNVIPELFIFQSIFETATCHRQDSARLGKDLCSHST